VLPTPPNLPNYSLPVNKTQSGIKTRSTPGGAPNNFNELRFEDKKGAEEVYLQGEKDWNILIKNNKVQTIGGCSGTTVAGALSETAKTITLTAEHGNQTGLRRQHHNPEPVRGHHSRAARSISND
jgi:uncharacterized protein involved in type VI secretion and phage assembly